MSFIYQCALLECNAVIFSHLMLNYLENDCSRHKRILVFLGVINKIHSGHLSYLQSLQSMGTADNNSL
jgi:bifunctional ADP-heptose synthase (sugar kinase/adenylyltransferase)